MPRTENYVIMKNKKGIEAHILKKKECFFILGILLLAGILWVGMRLSRKESEIIRITVDGKEYGIYPLSENQIISIGDTNVCQIKDGKAFMIEASCPDHLCMEQNAVDKTGGTIVCLPNKVVIEGGTTAATGQNSPGIDAVT